MPNQFLSPEGDIENYYVSEYWLIDQYIGDELWTWGYGDNGRLGNGATTGNFSTPLTTFAGGTNWKQVSAGSVHTTAIKTDGTLWTWGSGDSGQLGNAGYTVRSTPVTTFAGGTNWKQVSSGFGSYHTTAIKTDGTLWTWGRGYSGQLGNANATNRSTPITTFAGGTNWKQVSSVGYCTAAIKTDGTLWLWGSESFGELGNGIVTGNTSTPVTTFAGGTNWKQVSCGYSHTAAVKTDGTLWTWGYGYAGQLGNANNTDRSTPVTTFAGGTNWKQVSCGFYHTTAIKTDGTLWTWGTGTSGQLGNANNTDRSTPVTTFAGGTNWKQVSCGVNYITAIKTDGTLWIWGSGVSGKLGNANNTDRSTPVTTFAGGTNWKQISNTAAVTAGIPADLPLS
jgi:alpha-tubulin suppressor-like RCC1 family protein